MRATLIAVGALASVAGCAPPGPMEQLERAHAASLRDASPERALAYGEQFDTDLRFNNHLLTTDGRYATLLTDVLTTLDRAATSSPASAGPLLATKASILQYLDRKDEARAAAIASIAARPSYAAFKTLTWVGGDPVAWATACRSVRPVVTDFLQTCSVLQQCMADEVDHRGSGFPAELSASDEETLRKCGAWDQRWSEFTAREATSYCISECRRADASCQSLPQTCSGELLHCLQRCPSSQPEP